MSRQYKTKARSRWGTAGVYREYEQKTKNYQPGYANTYQKLHRLDGADHSA